LNFGIWIRVMMAPSCGTPDKVTISFKVRRSEDSSKERRSPPGSRDNFILRMLVLYLLILLEFYFLLTGDYRMSPPRAAWRLCIRSISRLRGEIVGLIGPNGSGKRRSQPHNRSLPDFPRTIRFKGDGSTASNLSRSVRKDRRTFRSPSLCPHDRPGEHHGRSPLRKRKASEDPKSEMSSEAILEQVAWGQKNAKVST